MSPAPLPMPDLDTTGERHRFYSLLRHAHCGCGFSLDMIDEALMSDLMTDHECFQPRQLEAVLTPIRRNQSLAAVAIVTVLAALAAVVVGAFITGQVPWQ